MKTRILLIAIFLITCKFELKAQEICGTPNFPLENINTLYSESNETSNLQPSVCINLFFHIVRSSNGTGGLNPNQLNEITNFLSQFYNPFDIYFVNSGYDFIDNTNFQQVDSENEAIQLTQQNNHSNAINYYIVESLWNVGMNFVTGTAISIPSNRLVIRRDRVLSSTSPHEVGHCLSLLHTFETSHCIEAINGSNCSTCGDLVCDTPADANTGAINGYNPDLTNIMSYYNDRDHFTNGQKNKMKTAILTSSLLQQVIGTNCAIPTISGPSNVCSGSSATYTVSNAPAGFTWSCSGFTKTSGSGNTATFTAISSGACWVGIKVGNVDIVKYNVWVGEPAIPYIISTERTHYNGTYTFTATGTTSGNPINCQWRIYTSIYGSLPLYMFTSPFPEGSYTFTNAPPVSASSPDVYYVSVVVNTSCGYSRESDMQRFTVQKGPLEIPIYYSAAYPNPAGNELIIDKIENSEALLTNTVKSVKEKSSEVTVLLYSHSTTKLVYNKTYPSSAKQIKIDTSTLPNGTYYLNIIENGEKIKQQTIIINH